MRGAPGNRRPYRKGLCPRLDESAGKRRSTRIRHTNPWLKTVLVQAAWAATRKKGSYLQSQFRRLKGRRGPKKEIVAVAASMLTAAYFMLRDEKDYHDLGGRYLEDRDKHRITADVSSNWASWTKANRNEWSLLQNPAERWFFGPISAGRMPVGECVRAEGNIAATRR